MIILAPTLAFLLGYEEARIKIEGIGSQNGEYTIHNGYP